jgi:hypothetical protein
MAEEQYAVMVKTSTRRQDSYGVYGSWGWQKEEGTRDARFFLGAHATRSDPQLINVLHWAKAPNSETNITIIISSIRARTVY